MYFIAVTLDVSKLSGWLNTDAPCRVERRAYELGRDTRQKGMVRRQRKRAEGEITAKYLAQETRGAHQKHPARGCDFGGIPIGDVRVEILQVVEEELMSVMAETSHSAMGPYVAIAAVESALYAWPAGKA